MESVKNAQSFLPKSQATSAWFAGVLEAGAIAGISVTEYNDKRGFLRRKTQPYLEIHSTYPPMLERLQSIYGGMRKPRFWNKGGRVAAEIVAETLPFTVARQDYVLAMGNWLNAENVDEQIAIARDLEGRGWQQRGNPHDYQELVTNPAFLAGILDSRATMYQRSAGRYHTLAVQIPSKNVALLEQLRDNYGGSIRVTDPAGTTIDHGAVSFKTRVDSHVWDILHTSAIDLVRYAQQFIQTPPPEGWDYQRGLEKAEEEQQLAQKIAEHARAEIVQLRTGELGQLSTNAGLAAMFKIGSVRISRYLEDILTPEELKARSDIIKQFAKRSVDAISTRQIAEHIRQEVESVQRGERDRLSYREELAELFGVSLKALKRHVIPSLDPDLQAARSTILRSQVVRDRNLAYWQTQREKQSSR